MYHISIYYGNIFIFRWGRGRLCHGHNGQSRPGRNGMSLTMTLSTWCLELTHMITRLRRRRLAQPFCNIGNALTKWSNRCLSIDDARVAKTVYGQWRSAGLSRFVIRVDQYVHSCKITSCYAQRLRFATPWLTDTQTLFEQSISLH